MPVDNLSFFDFVAVKQSTGEAVLVISDHLEWDEDYKHVIVLQKKITAYLEGIENGSLYEAYPDAKNRNILIEVKAKYQPNKIGRFFLEKAEIDLKAAGYRFSFSVVNPQPE